MSNKFLVRMNEARAIACEIISEGYTYKEIAEEFGLKLNQVGMLTKLLQEEDPKLFSQMKIASKYRDAIKFANKILRGQIKTEEIEVSSNEKELSRMLKRIYQYDTRLYICVKSRISNLIRNANKEET